MQSSILLPNGSKPKDGKIYNFKSETSSLSSISSARSEHNQLKKYFQKYARNSIDLNLNGNEYGNSTFRVGKHETVVSTGSGSSIGAPKIDLPVSEDESEEELKNCASPSLSEMLKEESESVSTLFSNSSNSSNSDEVVFQEYNLHADDDITSTITSEPPLKIIDCPSKIDKKSILNHDFTHLHEHNIDTKHLRFSINESVLTGQYILKKNLKTPKYSATFRVDPKKISQKNFIERVEVGGQNDWPLEI